MFKIHIGVLFRIFATINFRFLKRLKPYLLFTKFRLSFLVIISALSGYLFMGGSDLIVLIKLSLGGFFVTAASNGTNQILERRQDALMKRTQNRPLVTQEISMVNAVGLCIVFLLVGSYSLLSINTASCLLGIGAFLSYSFVYTPMKSKTPWAVFVGAFPGAIPPMLGAIAHTGSFGFIPGLLFFVQFMWQFPHFWAIAWAMHDDYLKAGYFLLPTRSGKSKQTALLISLYSAFLIPISLIPWVLNLTNVYSLIIVGALGVWFYFKSFRLYNLCDDSSAKKLMFASFVYLPVIQFTYVFTKVI
ncbi:MAG: protoheme farnesyltransferase [Bacteroidota bacterium]|jgi:protoheme IX farnesyltransferase